MAIFGKRSNQKGAVLVLFAVLMTGFITFIAFAIDFGNATVIFNELQNAADAGALAGANAPLVTSSMKINTTEVHDLARQASESNLKRMNGAEVKEIHIGHWSFKDRKFTARDHITEQLSGDPDFMDNLDYINAVEVTVMRSDAYSAFARWFHPEKYQRERKAVAAVGTFPSDEFDLPVAVCSFNISVNATGGATCGSLQFVDSNVNTAGWTTFEQPCGSSKLNPHEVFDCDSGNPYRVWPLPMKTSGGNVSAAYKEMRDCWWQDAKKKWSEPAPDQPWLLTVPVIQCKDQQNTGSCQSLVGTLRMQVVWISENGNAGPKPTVMTHPTTGLWTAPATGDPWPDFVEKFGITGQQDFVHSTMYVLPDCDFVPIAPTSFAGDDQVPVLVR